MYVCAYLFDDCVVAELLALFDLCSHLLYLVGQKAYLNTADTWYSRTSVATWANRLHMLAQVNSALHPSEVAKSSTSCNWLA